MFCSRNDRLWTFFSHKLSRKLNFSKWKFLFVKTYCFPFFFNWGHFWLHVDRWCFAVLFYSGALLSHQTMNHIYIILLPVSTLWYIICSLFNHALVLYIWVPSHNPNFPSLVVSIILVLSDCKLFQPSKNAWSPPSPPLHPHSYFPINQWNYFRNPHYRVVTKGIPLTTVVLYVEFIYRSSFSSHLSWYPLTPPTHPPFPCFDTTTYTQDNCMYNHELKGFEIFLRLPSKMVCLCKT